MSESDEFLDGKFLEDCEHERALRWPAECVECGGQGCPGRRERPRRLSTYVIARASLYALAASYPHGLGWRFYRSGGCHLGSGR